MLVDPGELEEVEALRELAVTLERYLKQGDDEDGYPHIDDDDLWDKLDIIRKIQRNSKKKN
jgi:hypothetical protein